MMRGPGLAIGKKGKIGVPKPGEKKPGYGGVGSVTTGSFTGKHRFNEALLQKAAKQGGERSSDRGL